MYGYKVMDTIFYSNIVQYVKFFNLHIRKWHCSIYFYVII